MTSSRKQAQFSTHEVRQCCENKLDIEFIITGKAFHGWYKKGDVRVRRITVPEEKQLIGKALYRSMASQLGLTTDQLDDLLGCTLKKEGYEEILKDQGMI
jgi:hypothetical protein